MSGETTVGSIVGFLRLNIADFEAGIAKAQAMAERLDRKDVDVRVKVDTAGAETKLAAVAAATDRADHSGRNLDATHRNMGRSARFLVGVLLTVGPALIPLAAATIGLAAGFGALGAAGVLAIVGINQEVKKGTPLGLAYTGMLQTLKGDLSTLGRTAATGVLGPFQIAVADLQRRMPTLNGLIGEFSGITGRTAGALMTGLVAAFISLAPLARDAGMYILNLTQRFAELMSGSGVVSFGDYVRSVFPHVMQQFEAIVGAVLHLVAAFAPFGTGVLTLLGAFATAINAIPVDVLSAIATGGLAIFLGFKTFALLSMPIHEVGVALRFVGVSSEVAAAGMRSLTIAAGVIGAIIAIATIAYTAHSESVRANQQAANDYTDALRASNGAIDENIRLMTVKKISEIDGFNTAKQYGITQKELTDAFLGVGNAQDVVNAKLAVGAGALTEGKSYSQQYAAQGSETAKKLGGLSEALNGNSSAFKQAKLDQQDQNAAMAASGSTADSAAAAHQRAAAAQAVLATATALATQKMQDENDAAGILKQSLDLLNGEAIDAANAQNAFESSLVNMGTHVNKTGKQITFTTTSINNMSSASVALRGQLNGQVANLQRVVEANGGLANSTGKGRAEMVKLRQQIIDNAVAHGVDRAAVTAYIDKLLKIPKKVPPTQLDIDKAAAAAKLKALQAQINAIKQHSKPGMGVDTAAAVEEITRLQQQINALHGKGVTITTFHVARGPGGSGGTTQAAGGPISGPGTGTSDSIPAWLSDGEYVINAAATARNRPLLHAINSGTAGFKTGGMASRAAGGSVSVAAPLAATSVQYFKGMAAGRTSGQIQAAIDAITKLTAAWKAAVDVAAALAQRADLVRAVAKASKTEMAAARQALVDFDKAAAVSRADAKIAAQQASLAARQELAANVQQVAANRAGWAFDHKSALDQLADVTRRLKAEKQYSDEWITLAKQREDIAAQIADAAKQADDARQQAITDAASKLNTMLDTRVGILGQLKAAQDTYSSSVAGANATLATQTQQLEDARRVALATWAKLDTQVQAGFAPSMSFLVSNAKAQIGQFTAWMEQFDLARQRGVSESVIASLGLDQGPQALTQLKQLNAGTLAQVQELNSLVAQQQQAAGAQVAREKAQMLGELGRGLLAANQQAADAISAAQATFMASQAELTAQLALVGTDQARSFTDAIAEGLLSGIPAIVAAAAAVQAAMGGAGSAGGGTSSGSLTYRTSGGTVLQTADTPANRKVLLDDGGTILSGHAGGGWVTGAGTGTSDSILARLSAGEFVVNAAAAARNATLLSAVNSGRRITSAPMVSAPSSSVNVAAPQVHVYVDGKEFKGLVRVELAQDRYDRGMSARRTVSA